MKINFNVRLSLLLVALLCIVGVVTSCAPSMGDGIIPYDSSTTSSPDAAHSNSGVFETTADATTELSPVSSSDENCTTEVPTSSGDIETSNDTTESDVITETETETENNSSVESRACQSVECFASRVHF